MGLPNITFIKGQGGLGRPLAGKDFVSALVFYVANGSLPTGFTTAARVKTFYSVAEAIAAGIKADYSDATASTATYLITAAGSTGDTINISANGLDSNGAPLLISLGTYAKTAADATIALLGASIAAKINEGTSTHGFSASFLTATLTITAPKKYGTFFNTGTVYVVTITGTIAGTITQNVVAGVASLQAQWYYQISEYFRVQPKGTLYVGFFAIPGAYDFAEVTSMQNFATGDIRQIGILKDPASAFSVANLTALDTVCKANDVLHKPIQALYAADLSGTADISTLTDLNVLTANKVSAVIGMDGGGQGYLLHKTTGKSVPQLGTLLGTVSLKKVSESIAWVGKFNLSDGIQQEKLAFANGQLFSSETITENFIDALNTKRYLFLKKFTGISGSYWNDSHTAISVASDYAYIENNQVIDKATRILYAAYIPNLNSPLKLNADGTLSDNTVAYLESVGDGALDAMVRDEEIGAKQVQIDTTQNVLATSKLVVSVALVINGVARQIEIPIGFKPQII